MNKLEVALRLTELYAKCNTGEEKRYTDVYNIMLENIKDSKDEELQQKQNKLIYELKKDKMEQFDDYVIYLLEKYLNILGVEENE